MNSASEFIGTNASEKTILLVSEIQLTALRSRIYWEIQKRLN